MTKDSDTGSADEYGPLLNFIWKFIFALSLSLWIQRGCASIYGCQSFGSDSLEKATKYTVHVDTLEYRKGDGCYHDYQIPIQYGKTECKMVSHILYRS